MSSTCLNTDLLNPRRVPRIPARLAVQVRYRFSAWSAETEDLGPRGCQLVTPRLVSLGREVKLEIDCPTLRRRVRASGTIAWARPEAPSRLGVAFEAGTERTWFEDLLAADPVSADAARRIPERLPRRARLYLGEPPGLIVDFTADELAVLRRVGSGTTVEELIRSFGAHPERPTGALFSLVARRLLVLDPGRSPGPVPWRPVLAQAEDTAAADGLGSAVPRPRPPRSAEVARLRAEALQHLAAGRLSLAANRLRDALALAPGDWALEAELARLAPFDTALRKPGGSVPRP